MSAWASSSKRSPCPVCGRDKGDKCRWRDDLILCWWGDRFSPPPNLRRGDVLDVGGAQWAVIRLDGGFAGNSLVLKPHIERERLSPLQRRQRQAAVAAAKPALQQRMGKLADTMRRIRKVHDYEHLRVHQLDVLMTGIRTAQATARDLRGDLFRARRDDPTLSRWIRCLDCWSRELTYWHRNTAQWFRRNLDQPTRGRRRPPKPDKRHTRQSVAAQP